MKHIIVKRLTDPNSKRGIFGEIITEEGKHLCVTFELPYRDNKQDISCIDAGTYRGKKRISKHNNTSIGGIVYELQDVEGRENIQFHIGNFLSNTLGCILVGTSTNMNVLYQSTKAMLKLIKYLGDDDFMVTIVNA